VKVAYLAWLILFGVMTLVFPFAGARGAFFHAGAALQPMWWSLAPLGLEKLLERLKRLGWGSAQALVVFRASMVMITMILTIFVVYLRLFKLGWGEGEAEYPEVERFLSERGIGPSDPVIVRNAPGYYISTGRPAISIPYGGQQTVREVAMVFGARYLIIEPEAVLKPLETLYQEPAENPGFEYLGELDETRVYRIEFDQNFPK
jgi:hypothetical protein